MTDSPRPSAARRRLPHARLAAPSAALALAAALAAAQTGTDAAAPSAERPSDVVDRRFASHVEPASGEARAALERLRLEGGLAAELWAAEPLLANPVCLYVARDGACYVAETFRHHAGVTDNRDHMDWLDDDLAARTVADRVAMFREHEGERFADYARAEERVRRVVDSDGDGTADAATVFAGGFRDPADGIGAGLLEHDGHVYYTCIPALWRLTDADGDGVAEERAALSEGYGVHVALLGHDLHGLRVGPYGKLFFTCGDRGFTVETADGTIEHAHTGAVLRCNPDGSELEVFATGLRNPQELAFDDTFDLFTGDNNSDGGDRARWVHVVRGADAGWRYSFQYVTEPVLRGPWNAERLWVPGFEGQAAYIVPPVANLADGPSGLTSDPGTGFGPRWRGAFFLCDFRGSAAHSGVHALWMQPAGASFALKRTERALWSVLATDCDFGPDGALYVSDWVEGWNKTGKGRVWRVLDPGTADDALVASTHELLRAGFGARPVRELAELLGHADRRVRHGAQLELVRSGPEGRAALVSATTVRPGPVLPPNPLLVRLHGIWGLGMVAREVPVVRRLFADLLEDEHAEVRAQAARTIGETGYFAARNLLLARLEDPSPRVRRECAIALGRLPARRAAPWLLRFLAGVGESDPVLRHAGVMGLANADFDALVVARHHESPHARIGALLALRRRREPAVELFLADPDPRVVVEAARAIHDVPIPGATASLAALVDRADLAGAALVRRVLAAALATGTEGGARGLARFALRADQAPAHRAEALAHLARWDAPPARDPVMGDWRPRVEPGATRGASALLRGLCDGLADEGLLAADAAPDVLVGWVALAARHGGETSRAALHALAVDAARPVEVRAAAVDALAAELDGGTTALLRALLADGDDRVRAAALAVLERAAPEEAVPVLRAALETGATAERRAALGALARLADPAADDVLAAALERLGADLFPAELALDLVLAIDARLAGASDARLAAASDAPSAPDPRLAELLERHRAPRRAADPRLAPWLDALAGGDPARGRALFREKTELSCLRCHALGEPDLNDGADAPGLSHGAGAPGLGTGAGAPGPMSGTDAQDSISGADAPDPTNGAGVQHPIRGAGAPGLVSGADAPGAPGASDGAGAGADGADSAVPIGPALVGVSRRLPRLALLEAIVDPNRTVAAGYEATFLAFADETFLEGRVLAESAESLQLVDADGVVHDVHPADVVTRKRALSAMPEGLEQHLTPREMRDLLAFLATL